MVTFNALVLFREIDVSTQAEQPETEDEVDPPVFRHECEFRFFQFPKSIEKFHLMFSITIRVRRTSGKGVV